MCFPRNSLIGSAYTTMLWPKLAHSRRNHLHRQLPRHTTTPTKPLLTTRNALSSTALNHLVKHLRHNNSRNLMRRANVGVREFCNHNNHTTNLPSTTMASYFHSNNSMKPDHHSLPLPFKFQYPTVQSVEEILSTTFTIQIQILFLHRHLTMPQEDDTMPEDRATLHLLRRQLSLIVHVPDRFRQDELNHMTPHALGHRHHRYMHR